MRYAPFLALIAAFLITATAQAREVDYYQIDHTHTNIRFETKTMGFFPLRGHFTKFDGKFRFDEEGLELQSGEMVIRANSIDTGKKERDAFLRGENFLDVEEHRKINIFIMRSEKVGPDKYKVYARLTIKGITREVPFDMEFEGKGVDRCYNKRIAMRGEGMIDRRDFDMGYDGTTKSGKPEYGNDIKIMFDVSGAYVSPNQVMYKCGDVESSREQM